VQRLGRRQKKALRKLHKRLRIDESEEVPDSRKVEALLRIHFRMTLPELRRLSDEAYWQRWYDYLYWREQERELLLGVMRQAINEAFSSTPLNTF
jgi:hypothetical protein